MRHWVKIKETAVNIWHEALFAARRLWRRFRITEFRLKRKHPRVPRLRWLALASLILVSSVIPTAQIVIQSRLYALSPDVKALVGTPNQALARKIAYQPEKRSWQFNQDSIPLGEGVQTASMPSLDDLKAQLGGEGDKDQTLYAVDMPTDGRKGVTYYDTNTDLSFTLTPQFQVGDGKQVDGHLVYPSEKGSQLVYTAKANGMKEDIILPKPIGDTAEFSYDLQLPDTLEAHIQDDGSLGVFSPNPTLFGTIAQGDDHEKILSARQTAPKDHLLFVLPAPFIKQAGGQDAPAQSRFRLSGNTLTISAKGLTDLNYPITIDPSVVITSSSDFASGNAEDMIDFGTTDQITRAGLTGGTTGSWSTTTSLTSLYGSGRTRMGFTTYGGYMYSAGGYNGSGQTGVAYAPINSGGGVGAWTATTPLPSVRFHHKAVAYNSHLYVLGGTNGGSFFDDVLYAPINSDGSLGSWTATTSFTGIRAALGAVAVNNYLYIAGGEYGSGNRQSDIQRAAIRTDGTLGGWTTVGSLPTGRGNIGMTAVNNNIYIVGGNSSGGVLHTATLRYPVNADGSLGSVVTEPNLPVGTGGGGNSTIVSRGYIYFAGGWTNSGATSAVYFAPIAANGSVGTWSTTNSFATARGWTNIAASGDYLYIAGGDNGADSAFYGDVQYSKLSDPGAVSSYTTSGNTFTNTRRGAATVVHDRYLYVIGGDNGGAASNTVYKALININGTIGTFSSTTAMPGSRTYAAAAAYNGRIYVIGGCSNTYSNCGSSGATDTVYSAATDPTNGNISGGWRTETSTITTARYGLSAAVYNGTLYVMGGLNNGSFNNTIHSHAINPSDGSVAGAWTNTSRTLPANMAYMASTIYGGVLYVAGGCTAGTVTCTTTRNQVHYAAINGDGTLAGSGALAQSGTFTTARGDFGITAVNGSLYIAGGRTSATYYNDTQFAPLNTDGTVGAWTTVSGATLASARASAGVVSANGTIHVTGGYNGSTYYNNVQQAKVNHGGSGMVDSWITDSTDTFTTGRSKAQTVTYNGYIYILGGHNGGTNYNTVQYAPLNTDGTVGAWTATSSFATARQTFSATAMNGYMYILGGWTGSADMQDIQYARINTDGSLGSWAAAGNDVSSNGGQGACIAAHNGYIYSLGGWDGSTNHNSVLYATQHSNGTIGNWATTNSFITARSNLNCVVNGNYLYISGGEGTQTYNDVQFAAINSDGTLGSWTPTTSFALARVGHAMFSYNGFMYIVGGVNAVGGSTARNDMQYAPINANGTVGQWFRFAGMSDSSYMDIVAHNGYAYAPSQVTGNTNTRYAPLDSIVRVGRYSKVVDIGSSAGITKVAWNGQLPGGGLQVSYRVAGDDGVFGSLGTVAAAQSASSPCVAPYGDGRYIWLSVALDDSTTATFPDTSRAYLTDITVSYGSSRPTPDIRLRGGKTLQNGIRSPLDTCPA